MHAILFAAMETRSPFILQCSANVRKYINPIMVRSMAAGCKEILDAENIPLPMALHLDHGTTFEECVSAIDEGFSSVMIDGSALSLDKNIELTARVVEYAKQYDVSVEGELGNLSGAEEGVAHADSVYTDPGAVQEFVQRTGVNSLAVSIGTSHGVTKIKIKPGEAPPSLRFDILSEIERRLPGFPIVLHGSSTIPQNYVDMINQYGGHLKEAQGIPIEQIKRAVKTSVCKINIASDGWIIMTAITRRVLAENPGAIDPRVFLSQSRNAMKDLYVFKMRDVFLSSGLV
jgi:fructose-bisphosphate aldolase class II